MVRKLSITIVIILIIIGGVIFLKTRQGQSGDTLVVYSGRSAALVAPLFQQFEQDSGINLDVRYNDTPPLATQVLQEGDSTPAEVLFFQDSGYLGLLANAGLLQQLDPEILNQVDPAFRDPGGYWVGVSGRMRVLSYDPNVISEQDLPKTLTDLLDPKYKGQVGVTFDNPSFQAQITALRTLWGEQKTLEWLQGLKDNDVRNYGTSPQVVSAVANGEILMGLTNHYYLYNLKKNNPNLAAANYIFPAEGKDANLMIVSGIAITEGSHQVALAKKFIEYLLSPKAQQYITMAVYEYPTRSGFAANPELPDIKQTELADINQTVLADLNPTIQDLQQLGLL